MVDVQLGATVGAGVGKRVETVSNGPHADLRIRTLGPLTVVADDAVLPLPASRKARALLAYLAVADEPVGRSRLCDLLWEIPNDPRAELRWCLAKIRASLGPADAKTVETLGDAVRLRFDGDVVDALVVARTVKTANALDLHHLRSAANLVGGEFLEGLRVDHSPQFDSWLVAQRRRFRSLSATLLENFACRLHAESDEKIVALEKWVSLAPSDARANATLVTALQRAGRISDAERQFESAMRSFADKGLDAGVIRAAWRAAKASPARLPSASHAEGLRTVRAVPPLQTVGGAALTPRASLAVLPLVADDQTRSFGGLAAGLTDDIITRLAKLRSLFVIGRGSVFALAERGIGADNAGRMLGVDFTVGGFVQRQVGRILISIELVEVRTARIVWAEVFDRRVDDALGLFDEVGNAIVASISAEVEKVERDRAMLKPPDSLNAWEAYHRGLWHMYRFTRAENERAQHFFERAVALDPTFAGGHVGLSFTHWQCAFQHWGDRDTESDQAIAAAGMGLHVDEQSPMAHCAMGRALWLRGGQDDALRELEIAVALSPNFAFGHYSLAFVHCQSGDPETAIGSSAVSRGLSPFDPLLFAMMAANAISLVRLGRFEEAAEWALKGAAKPNAHNVILATAAHCLGLLGRIEEARKIIGDIRRSAPAFSVDDFLTSFRFRPDDASLFRDCSRRIGLG